MTSAQGSGQNSEECEHLRQQGSIKEEQRGCNQQVRRKTQTAWHERASEAVAELTETCHLKGGTTREPNGCALMRKWGEEVETVSLESSLCKTWPPRKVK